MIRCVRARRIKMAVASGNPVGAVLLLDNELMDSSTPSTTMFFGASGPIEVDKESIELEVSLTRQRIQSNGDPDHQRKGNDSPS